VYAVVGDDVIEAFELSYDEGSVGPGTGVRDVEVVAAFLCGKFGIGFVLDPVSEDGGLALEFAALVAGFYLRRC
jgi:hypothetical protein